MSIEYAFRSVHPDFRSWNGFRWPFPGGTATAANPDPTNTDPCPTRIGDGICLAKTARGAASGGIPLHTVLVCTYTEADVLGEDDHKIRVRHATVQEVYDFPAVLRGKRDGHTALPTKANLRGANLREANLASADLASADLSGAYLTSADLAYATLAYADLSGAYLAYATLAYADLAYANLASADLSGANLAYAYLAYANLSGAYLAYANLSNARGNRYTALPPGYEVRDGLVVAL